MSTSKGIALAGAILCTSSALAAPIDLGGVNPGTPDVVDRTFTDGAFSTRFDAAYTDNAPGTLDLRGDASGNLMTGGSSGANVRYDFSFDDALGRIVISGVDTGPGSLFGTLGARDAYVISFAGDIVVDDDGNDDLANLVFGSDSVSFSFVNGGADDWSITLLGGVSAFSVDYTNTAGGSNRATLNLQGFAPVPAPAAPWLLGLGIAAAGMRRRRR